MIIKQKKDDIFDYNQKNQKNGKDNSNTKLQKQNIYIKNF